MSKGKASESCFDLYTPLVMAAGAYIVQCKAGDVEIKSAFEFDVKEAKKAIINKFVPASFKKGQQLFKANVR